MTQNTDKLVRSQHSANKEILSAIKNLSDKTDKKFKDLYEVVTFIKDNVPMKDEVVLKSEFEEKMAKMATKKDLEKFATKEDLAKFATKEDLAKTECRLVTKSYLDDKLADAISEIGKRINGVKEKGKVFNQKLVAFLDKHTVFETGEINELKELI